MPNGSGVAVRVMIVDHEDVVRKAFRVAVENSPGLVVVAESRDVSEALTVAERTQPDVVLLEINMTSHGFDDLIERLRVRSTGRSKVLVLTSRDDDEALYLSLRARASGFLLKDVKEEDLVNALYAVASGDAVISPRMTKRLIERFDIAPPKGLNGGADVLGSLSERENEVLGGLVRGWSNKRIAEELHVALATIKTHVSNVLAKLGVRTRVEAALLAREAGVCLIADIARS